MSARTRHAARYRAVAVARESAEAASVSLLDPQRRTFPRLGTVEVQSIMQLMDISDRLQLARCSRQLFADAANSYAWNDCTTSGVGTIGGRVMVNPALLIAAATKNVIQKSLLQYVPNGLTLVLPLRADSFKDILSMEVFEMWLTNMDGLELQQVGRSIIDAASLRLGLNQSKLRQRIRRLKCELSSYYALGMQFPIDELMFFPQLTTVHLIRIQLPHHFQTTLLRIPELTTLILDRILYECQTGGYWIDHPSGQKKLVPSGQSHPRPRPQTQSGQHLYRAKSKLRQISMLNMPDCLGERYEFVFLHFLPFQLEELVLSNSIVIGFSGEGHPDKYRQAFRLPSSLKRLELMDLTYYSSICPYLTQLPALEILRIVIHFPLPTVTRDHMPPGERITRKMIETILTPKPKLQIEMTVIRRTNEPSNDRMDEFLLEMEECSEDFPEQFSIQTRDG